MRSTMRRLATGIVWLLAVTVAFLASPLYAAEVPPGQKEVVFAGAGGTFETNFRTKIFPKFEQKTGIKVIYATGTTTGNFAKVQAQRARPEIDVIWTNDVTHGMGKQTGLYASLDPKRVTNLEYVYPFARDPDGIGVTQGVAAIGLEYNTRIFREKGLVLPTSWYDLWRPDLKGHVAIYTVPHGYGNLFLALMAKLERGSEQNVEPGLAKIKALAPNVLAFPDAPAQLDNLLKQGEVWLTYNATPRVFELQATGFSVDFLYPKEGAIYFVNYFDVVKGAPHPEAAQEFVNFLIGEEAQLGMAVEMLWGPINSRVKLPPDVARKVPSTPEQLKSLVRIDTRAVSANLQTWTERWRREVEGR